MRECFQFKGMSVLDHGMDVRSRYLDIEDCVHGLDRPDLKLPVWIRHPLIIECILSDDRDTTELYQVYHDCGKPICRIVDDEGRQHFPDHAAASKARWLECGGCPEVAELIGMDMDAHTMRMADAQEFARRPQALTLLLTALAEVHSNAEMFGGTDSVGFKIKYKHLDRFGARVIRELEGK